MKTHDGSGCVQALEPKAGRVLSARRWRPWAQTVVGGGLYIYALFHPDCIMLIMFAIAPLIVTVAMLEIDAIEAEDDHVRHRGWRQPATRPGRGLRLVYSAPRPAAAAARRP
jgi:hypothetical protein